MPSLSPATVHADAAVDVLFGEGGLDWFWFANGRTAIDRLADLMGGEAASPSAGVPKTS